MKLVVEENNAISTKPIYEFEFAPCAKSSFFDILPRNELKLSEFVVKPIVKSSSNNVVNASKSTLSPSLVYPQVLSIPAGRTNT